MKGQRHILLYIVKMVGVYALVGLTVSLKFGRAILSKSR